VDVRKKSCRVLFYVEAGVAVWCCLQSGRGRNCFYKCEGVRVRVENRRAVYYGMEVRLGEGLVLRRYF
jgi:hypothetical protein